MIKNKKGFTLVEVIIATALIGIIAVGILPAFSTQLRMMVNTRKITTVSFDAQGAIEDEVQAKKEILRPLGELESATKTSLNIFERTVNMHKINVEYPLNDKKEFTVYLSERLAEMEYRNPLVANYVRIDEEKTDTSVIAENIETVSVRASSKLKNVKGVYEIKDYTSSQDLNIYRWYRSKEGITDPQYPADFEFVELWRNKKTISKDELKEYAVNRYLMLVLIPVDKSGVRGDEKPSQKVYVQGEEWRSGIFAWIDKNLDGQYLDANDIALKDVISALKWILLRGFDTQTPFQNPENPSNNLDPKDGSLYVPMGVRRASISDKSGKIEVSDTEFINWRVAKSIHLANNIDVKNNTDINMKTTEGTIKLYRFVDIDYKGDAVFGSNGKVVLLDKGVELQGNNIILSAGEEWGSIIIEAFTKLTAAKSMMLTSAENIIIDKSTLNAGENILLYSKKKDSVDNIVLKDTQINAGQQLVFETSGTFSGGGWADSTKVIVENDKILKISGWVDNQGTMELGDTGGIEFDNSMSEQLENSIRLLLSKSGNTKVLISSNYGRNIGYADYNDYETVKSDLVAQNLGAGQTNLRYTSEKLSGEGMPDIYYSFDGTDTISIKATKTSTQAYANYYKLIVEDKYAKGISSNIIFKVSAEAGQEPVVEVIGPTMPIVTVTFNANGGTFDDGGITKEIQSEDGAPLSAMPENPKMKGYAFVGWNIKPDGSGTYVSLSYNINGSMTVYAQWGKKAEYEVKFLKNTTDQGSTEAIPNSMKVFDGEEIGTLPAPPTRPGYHFNGWKTQGGTPITEDTIVTGNITAYAQWSKKASYAVTFDENGGNRLNPRTRTVTDGTPIGTLPVPTRSNYRFNGWNTQKNGNGAVVTENTIVTGTMTIYAQWVRVYTVTFDKNHSDWWSYTEANPRTIPVDEGQTIGTLPAPPTRKGYSFDGWYDSKNFNKGKKVDQNTKVTRDMTVYAKWK